MIKINKTIVKFLLFTILFISFSQFADAQTPLPTPAPLAPVDGATLTIGTPTFAWSTVTGATPPIVYDLQVATSGAMTTTLINKPNIATNTYSLSGDETLASGTYWWQVRARDSATPSFNYSSWSSPPWSLTINVPPATSTRVGMFGIVRAVATAAFTLETRTDGAQTRQIQIAVTDQTKIAAPPVQAASISDIKVGSRVAVLAALSNGLYTAMQVVIIPAQPVRRQIQGVVMNIQGSQLTLVDPDGKVYDLQLQSQPGAAAPSVGQFIIATVQEDPSSKQLFLVAFETSKNLLDRLQRDLDKVSSKQDIDKISQILTANADRHIAVLQRVLDKSPDQAKPALNKVLDDAEARKTDIQDKIDKKRGKGDQSSASPGPSGPPGSPSPGKSDDDKQGKSGGSNGTSRPSSSPGNANQDRETPPNQPADHAGRTACLVCHETGIAGAPKFPANHAGRTDATCPACHKAPQ